MPADAAIDAEVDLHNGRSAYFLSARLKVSLPGISPDIAESLIDDAHGLCPYSKATRSNIDVTITVI